MKRLWVIIVNLFVLGLPTLALAAAEKAEALQKKIANLDQLSGLNRLFATWYNDNMWLYAIIVTALMGVIGMLIALVTDIILKIIGMEVHKIEHHE